VGTNGLTRRDLLAERITVLEARKLWKCLALLALVVSLNLTGCATYYKLMDNREYGRCLERCDETWRGADDVSARQTCRSRCEADREWRSQARPDMDK